MHVYLMEIHRALGRIEGAQQRMSSEMIREFSEVKRRVRKLERGGIRPPFIELVIKNVLTWALPAATLWATGSIETALKVLEAVK